MSEQIDIKISATGEITYSVKGVKGSGCKALTKPIDELAGEVLESKNTAEYCQLPDEREKVRQK